MIHSRPQFLSKFKPRFTKNRYQLALKFRLIKEPDFFVFQTEADPARSVGPSGEASQSSPPLGAEHATDNFPGFLFTCFFAPAGGEAIVGVVGLML